MTTAPTLTIIDYGMGNVQSVRNAVAAAGATAVLSDRAEDIGIADGLLLPGVGAFGEAMRNLERTGQASAIREAVAAGVPLLGICLGMQLLAESSDERGQHRGLGIVPGNVRRVRVEPGTRLPHVGWNTVVTTREDRLFDGVEPGSDFYFVHTYEVDGDEQDVLAHTDYDGPVVAALARDGVWATQFHPERSQTKGKRLIANFVSIVRDRVQAAAC